jgi:hypothetical protein
MPETTTKFVCKAPVFKGILCPLKRYLFLVEHCKDGNDDPNIILN